MTTRLIPACMVAVALMLSPRLALPLVDPAPSSLPTPLWMAQIFVKQGNALAAFCKGALISARWIVTTGYCLFDPYEALGPRRDASDAEYVVRFGDSLTQHEVETFVQSSDFTVGMMKLREPAAIEPVPLGTKSRKELWNQDVFILGKESTAAVGDAAFNPDFGKRMYCRIDGQTYFSPGKICYVMAKRTLSSVLLETRAIVIDPEAPGAPNSALDTLKPFDKTGARMYLDFRADASYPCYEDLGAPILRRNDAGKIELAGVVAGVGMAMGTAVRTPLCNPSLGNVFSNISYYRAFIEKTLIQSAFETVCPATPKLEVEYPGGTQVRVFWKPVSGATGYRLQYTNRVGYVPFKVLDVGNKTEVKAEVSSEFIYRVVIVAYNDICTSPLSEELPVEL